MFETYQECTLLKRLPLANGCWKTQPGIFHSCLRMRIASFIQKLLARVHRVLVERAAWAVETLVWAKGVESVVDAARRAMVDRMAGAGVVLDAAVGCGATQMLSWPLIPGNIPLRTSPNQSCFLCLL
jgi:hypothetical protein